MTSLLVLQKPTYPQIFMLIYGFLFELWVLNLNKEEEKKKMKNSAFHSPIHLPQSTVVLCIQVNEKSCRLRMATYRDGVKRKGDKIGMGV